MRKTLITICLSTGLLISACGSDSNTQPNPEPSEPSLPTFSHIGLSDHSVHKIIEINNRLIALTDKGIHLYDKQWQVLTSADFEVFDLVAISDSHWLASVAQGEQHFFIETYDSGVNWSSFSDEFGDDFLPNEIANTLLYDQKNSTLYATGLDVLASSKDYGRTWFVESGNWAGAAAGLHSIAMHQAAGDIWYGGQNGIEQSVLNQYNIESMDLIMHDQAISELMPNPSTVRQILFDSKNSKRVIASGEGGIVESLDYGETWQPMLTKQNYRFHFSPVFDVKNEQKIYTAGWDKGNKEQPLILEVSANNGESWTSYRSEKDENLGGVRSILASEIDGQSVLFIGLYYNGVVKVTFN